MADVDKRLRRLEVEGRTSAIAGWAQARIYDRAHMSAQVPSGFKHCRPVPRKQQQRGATIVEFALFFLLFLVLCVGLMEGARAIWTYTTVAHAARQGARFAMVHGSGNPVSDSYIRNVVKNNAVGLNPNDITVLTAWIPDNERGSTVQVAASYNFRFVTSRLVFPNSSLQIGSTSRMVIGN